MNKYLLGSLLLISNAPLCAQDFPNGDFESFKDKTWNSVGAEPTDWFGSNVDQMGLVHVQEVYKDESDKRPESSGKVSVRMMNMYAGIGGAPLGANAPAYITLGSPWVKAAVPASNSDGGTYGGKEFSFKPDAIRGYIKRVLTDQAADANGTPRKDETCNIIFYSWTGHTHSIISGISSSPTKDDIINNDVIDLDRAILKGVSGVPTNAYSTTYDDNFKLVSVGKFDITPESEYASGEWKPIEIPITYKENDVVPENMNIIISAADYFNRGNIGDGNQLWADDFEFVYYSELASLTYDGKLITVQENMDLSDQMYDENKLGYTLTGKGATVDKSFNKVTGVLTLTVKGNDWTEVNPSNQHVYTIQFAKPIPSSAEVAGDYDPLLNISVFNKVVPSVNDISISEKDGSVVFTMKNFNFAGVLDMGDIEVPGATLSYVDNGIKISVVEQKVILKIGPATISIDAVVDNNKELTGTVSIDYSGLPVSVSMVKCPFERVLTNYTLTVKGDVTSDVAAAVVPLGEKVGLVDLTQATLGAELNTSNFLYDPENTTSNTLYKIADTQSLKGNNVIKNGACDNFVLTDGQSFNAPEGFTASQITYERAVAASTTDKDEVYTFVLPFTFTADKVNGTVYELTGVSDGVLDFTSLEGSMELKANRPYLVVSNGTQLLNASAFSGEVVATGDLTNEVYGGVTMVGAYEATPITSDASWYGYNAKGEFVKATSGTINPFRTAIKSTGSQSSFALKLDGTVTGIVNLENPNAKVDVYTISGVCVRKNVPAASALNGLSRGVYIVGGQKVVK